MLTLKQVEALYWIAQLGSFEAAAIKLNASQSAVSKRIQELESTYNLEVFDRSRRSAKLTEKGNELLQYAKELLERRDEIVERISAKEVLVKRLRLGVTELTAMTWLPHLITAIRRDYPKVTVEAEVELSSTLRERLSDDSFDVIIVPAAPDDDQFVCKHLTTVENAWMCSPQLLQSKKVIPLSEIAKHAIITQGKASGTGALYGKFLQENGVQAQKIVAVNNLLAQIGLTISGMGISYLPKQCMQYLVAAGVLGIVKSSPPLPHVDYVALSRADRLHSLNGDVTRLAIGCCDYSKLLLQPPSQEAA